MGVIERVTSQLVPLSDQGVHIVGKKHVSGLDLLTHQSQ
jgi:hypothetical protein